MWPGASRGAGGAKGGKLGRPLPSPAWASSDLERYTEISCTCFCAAVIFETVLAAVKEATGATNVYLGKKIQLPEAAPYVSGPPQDPPQHPGSV